MSEKKRLKVLIADDEKHIRALIKKILQSMKIEIAGEAQNGQQALEKFKEIKPHMTFLDVNMPVKDGKEALKEIKSMAPNSCVVMLTSVTSMEVVRECLELGADNYIRKDIEISEMKNLIKQTWQDYVQSVSQA